MNRFYNTLAALAVILTPVAMMTAVGWTAYAAILAQTGVLWLAVLSGLATAAAIEAVGIVAGETALWFHAHHDRRWWTAAVILALYVAFGLALLRGTPLALLPLLAGAVYVLVGLRAQAAREAIAANGHEAAALEWQREQWRIRQADKTRLKLAEIEQHAGTMPALNGTTPAQSNGMPAHAPHECDQCNRNFATVQALNAHKRFCERNRNSEHPHASTNDV